MIKAFYDDKTHKVEVHIHGDPDTILQELRAIITIINERIGKEGAAEND